MRSLYLTLIYSFFLVTGIAAPFVLTLGYVWVDIVRPNEIVYSILNRVPTSMIMGLAAILVYVLLDRRSRPKLGAFIVLTVSFALWTTLTTTWAEVPALAWYKWNFAVKTILFSVFVPFVIRSRAQIEAFLLVYVFSFSAHIISAGANTVLTGGGYNRALGLLVNNSGIAESSTLAAICCSLIPLIVFLKNQSRIVSAKIVVVRLIYWGLLCACVVAALGSYARTALVGLLLVAIHSWLKSRHKLLFAMLVLIIVTAGTPLMPKPWQDRMSTIITYQQDTSAASRITVWEWTLDYVATHPLGGGFNVYAVDQVVPGGLAFHNIFFEVLGEHGYVGLAIFLGMIGTSIANLLRVRKRARAYPELNWCSALATQLLAAQVVLLSCGMFIGIAFQPPIYYLLSVSVCLSEYFRRVHTGRGQFSTQALAIDAVGN